jgi:hypothetical protein
MFYSFLFLAMNKEQQHNLYIILQFIRINVFVSSSRNKDCKPMCVKKLHFDGRNPQNFETRKGEVMGDKISRGCAFHFLW